jgi:uncharacterized protein YprB with RNaseH-like and TPR domain
VPGIGLEAERSLWMQGCLDWDEFARHPGKYSVGSASKELAIQVIEASRRALDEAHYQFFARSLSQAEAWRAWPDFADSCLYLDIETDGGTSGQAITTIGLYNGQNYRCLVRGRDLELFRDAISHYALIVTFFGTGFDVPMLQKRFRGLEFDQIHLDLCPTLRRLGYRGGLKRIEQQLGIGRSDETAGLDGLDAIRLWREYEWGRDDAALERLISYNREDVVNLERLAKIAYEALRAQRFAPIQSALA